MEYDTRHGGDGVVWRYRRGLDPAFSPDWFSDEAQRRHGWLTGRPGAGRAPASLLQIGGLDLVLRRFHRGGLMRHLSADRYLYLGLERTRALREFAVLARLETLALPAPTPVAVEIRRSALVYRAALLMQRLPGETLAQRLIHGICDTDWSNVGCCIRRFHDAGLWHADLNAHNVLLDTRSRNRPCALIDFDRARWRGQGAGRWQADNLQRLQRSVRKLTGEQPGVTGPGWSALLDGYLQSSRSR